jgi:hypothetical protein
MDNRNESISPLEIISKQETITEELPESFKDKAKGWVVDTSLAVLWSNVIFGPNEYILGGLRGSEFVKQRVGMSLFNLVFGGAFGKFRNYWAKNIMKATPNSSRLYKAVNDITASVIFYGPLYVGLMKSLGASWEETFAALGGGVLTCTIAGRPYGWCQDKWRKLFGVKPALEK